MLGVASEAEGKDTGGTAKLWRRDTIALAFWHRSVLTARRFETNVLVFTRSGADTI